MQNNDASVQQSINIFSRVLAVLVLVVLPGIGGAMLDKSFGIHLLAPIGLAIGMMFGVLGLWIFIKRVGKTTQFPQRPFNESKSVETFEDSKRIFDADQQAD